MKVPSFAIIAFAIVAVLISAAPASAQVGRGLSGPHYNLNIIGVPKNKTADMTNTDGHTIFIPLESGGDVSRQVKIFYVASDAFEVLDRNCTDGQCTIQVPSGLLGNLCYDVYAFGLGQPGHNLVVQADCIIDDLVGSCQDALLLDTFTVYRPKGKPQRHDISDVFRATGCVDLNASTTCDSGDLQFTNVWIFNVPQLESYWWDVDNNGLKHMQIRFYETTCGSISTVP